MLDDVDDFLTRVIDRFTPGELVEALGITCEDLVDRFYDELTQLHGESIFDYFEG